MFENPVRHSSIEIHKAITLLGASDCIVVHKQCDTTFDKSNQASGLSNESIQRMIIRGPSTYYPGPKETVLNSHSRGAECIFNLASRPWNVEFAFGSDKSKGTLKLGFRFTISDIGAMLDHSSDLMGDLHDALNADILNIASSATDMKALEALNNFNYFPNLLTISAKMGVTMESVSFRGFELSSESKRSQEAVKEMHARMSREAMLAAEEEKKIKADISARQARLTMEHDLEEAVLRGKQARLASEQAFYQNQQDYEEELTKKKLEAQLIYHRKVNDESMRVLTGLKDLGTDITKLLCERNTTDEGSKNLNLGRDGLIKASPSLNDWFSVPLSTGIVQNVNERAKEE